MSTLKSSTPLNDYSPYSFLGGKDTIGEKPATSLDWVSIVRSGLPVVSVDKAVSALNMPRSSLVMALGLSERTVARRLKGGIRLTPEESAKMVRLAKVFSRAVEVFEDSQSATNWLNTSNHSLGNIEPLTLLDTEIGGDIVLDALGRLEHGIFA